MTLVIIDSNEPATNPTIAHELATVFGEQNLVVAPLQFGDLNIPLETGLLAVERKTPEDLLNSVSDGRLFAQADALVASAQFPAFVVHGEFRYNKEGYVVVNGRATGWKARSVRAALLSVQWSGCAVVQVPSDEYATAVLEMVGLASHPEHIQHKSEHPITFPPMDSRIEFLCGVPGVGPQRAEALLRLAKSYTGRPPNPDVEMGNLCDALTLGTGLGQSFSPPSPEGWGPITIKRYREFLGLYPQQLLALVNISDAVITTGASK